MVDTNIDTCTVCHWALRATSEVALGLRGGEAEEERLSTVTTFIGRSCWAFVSGLSAIGQGFPSLKVEPLFGGVEGLQRCGSEFLVGC